MKKVSAHQEIDPLLRAIDEAWPRIDRILGIALHDIYHAGQIRLLRRLQQGRAKKPK